MHALFLTLIAFLVAPISVTLAAFPQPSGTQLKDNLITGPQGVIGFIDVIANWIFAILITISVLYILLAAYKYMTSSGENVEAAHRMLLYAAVGIAVAVLSKGIVFTVRKLVDRNTTLPASTILYHDYHA